MFDASSDDPTLRPDLLRHVDHRAVVKRDDLALLDEMIVDPDDTAVENGSAESVEALSGAVAGMETDADADDVLRSRAMDSTSSKRWQATPRRWADETTKRSHQLRDAMLGEGGVLLARCDLSHSPLL